MTKQNSFNGPSQRQLRVGELIRRELADIIGRGDHFEKDLESNLVTIGEVRTSPDLRVATVMVYAHGENEQAAVDVLNRIAGRLRVQVAKRVKLRYSAELRFKLDRSLDFAEETQKLLNALPEYSDENRDE